MTEDILKQIEAIPYRKRTQGRCPKCEVVMIWNVDHGSGITKGRLACPNCGSVLLRTHCRSTLPVVVRRPVVRSES